MATMSLPVEQLAQMMQLPDSWVILEVKSGNNEMWISVKETSKLDESKTEVLRHLEFLGNFSFPNSIWECMQGRSASYY